MKEEYRLLVALQDLDIMIREMHDTSTTQEFENMGFKIEGLDELKQARSDLAAKIPTMLLNRYERLAGHFKVAILPVTGDKCLGCFVKLPTSFFSAALRTELLTCENCGRMLYIP